MGVAGIEMEKVALPTKKKMQRGAQGGYAMCRRDVTGFIGIIHQLRWMSSWRPAAKTAVFFKKKVQIQAA